MHALEQDLRLAARACDRLADLRFAVAETAAKCRDQDAMQELLEALKDTE